jgi:hypothetical protein
MFVEEGETSLVDPMRFGNCATHAPTTNISSRALAVRSILDFQRPASMAPDWLFQDWPAAAEELGPGFAGSSRRWIVIHQMAPRIVANASWVFAEMPKCHRFKAMRFGA